MKIIIFAAAIIATVQFMPAEFGIIALCAPVGIAIGRPIARVVEGLIG